MSDDNTQTAEQPPAEGRKKTTKRRLAMAAARVAGWTTLGAAIGGVAGPVMTHSARNLQAQAEIQQEPGREDEIRAETARRNRDTLVRDAGIGAGAGAAFGARGGLYLEGGMAAVSFLRNRRKKKQGEDGELEEAPPVRSR